MSKKVSRKRIDKGEGKRNHVSMVAKASFLPVKPLEDCKQVNGAIWLTVRRIPLDTVLKMAVKACGSKQRNQLGKISWQLKLDKRGWMLGQAWEK